MATNETEKINATQGTEEKLPCSKCDGKAYHKVLLSVDKSGEDHDGDFDYYRDEHYQIKG
jgi:hypothetical protein